MQIIIDHVRHEYAGVAALRIFHDLPGPLKAEKPDRIAGFVPDVYAFDAPLTVRIIGEAKTQADLETAHSQEQIAAFLTFLGQQEHGVFVLAVPWAAKRLAHVLVETKRAAVGAQSVRTTILDDLTLRREC